MTAVKLNSNKQKIFDYLTKTKGVSVPAAYKVALKPQVTIKRVLQSIALFEEVRLDPNVYGVERIPASYFENVLAAPQSKIKNWLISSIKNQLMDDHAIKTLDRVFPNWREKKISRVVHPSMLLSKWLELHELGLEANEDNLRHIPINRTGTITKKTISKKDTFVVRSKIKALKDAGVPLKGVPEKLSLPQAEFDALIQRYKAGRKFTQNQEDIYNFLKSKGASEELAFGLANKKKLSLEAIKRKISYIGTIELDPLVYGLSKIPLIRYEEYLGLPFQVFKMRINERVIQKLKDNHAARILDKEFPWWRIKKKLARRSPATVLLVFRTLEERGLSPRAWLVTNKSLSSVLDGEKILQRKQLSRKEQVPQKRTFRFSGPNLSYQEKVNEFIGENHLPRPVFQQMLDAYSEIFGETKQKNIDYVTQRILERVNSRAHIVPYDKIFKFASRAMYGYWKKE